LRISSKTSSFLEDHKTYDAVERCLERISEAATKLAGTAESMCPVIPWFAIRSPGNFLRHEYVRIEGERLWLVVWCDLAPLKAVL
jgi:uncharacterized protein with HEPN domain